MAHGSVEKFTIAVPDEVLTDLRERLARTRLPGEVRDSGWDYGTNLAYLKELIEYWRTRYDWRAQERELNRFAHFKVNVNGCGIHFIHQKGAGKNPKPLLLHGWPGSIVEFQQIIPMLTDPANHGGDSGDSLTVVAPSLPGYGLSDDPKVRGVEVRRIAEMFHELMTGALGYQRFGVQGGDWGSIITARLGQAFPANVIGVHLNMVPAAPPQPLPSELSEDEKRYLADMQRYRNEESGYAQIQGTKPQTLAYGLNDSPAGLAAWIVEKFRTWSDCGGDVERRYTKDQLLTNIMVYWVTQTINSSTRLYYEVRHNPPAFPTPENPVKPPTAAACFPAEIISSSRSWAERSYNVKRWTKFPRGGHFAAMEEPAALAADIRAFFRELNHASQ